MPEIFRKVARVTERPSIRRPSPRERGYDAAWDRTSKLYRRRNPFCERCAEDEDGRIVFADVVDHKHPVQDGGVIHCGWPGLWSLCTACHAWKALLEDHARETGQMSQIVRWCDEPASRPQLRRGDVRA